MTKSIFRIDEVRSTGKSTYRLEGQVESGQVSVGACFRLSAPDRSAGVEFAGRVESIETYGKPTDRLTQGWTGSLHVTTDDKAPVSGDILTFETP